MLPLALDVSQLPIALIGGGPQALRRLEALDDAGARLVRVFASAASPELAARAGTRLSARFPEDNEIAAASLVFIGDVSPAEAAPLAAAARAHGRLVNVEDVTALCDFHMPAIVRRGDLVIGVSTGGASPALARRIRERLERLFGPEWGQRLQRLRTEREALRAKGLTPPQVSERAQALIDAEGWLA